MSEKEFDPLDTRERDAQQVEQDDAKRSARQAEIDDFMWLMRHPQGRRFMWRLLGLTGVFRNPFTGNSETFFRCGEMNIGQKLLGEIHEMCPDKYIEMVKEQNGTKRNVDRRDSKPT